MPDPVNRLLPLIPEVGSAVKAFLDVMVHRPPDRDRDPGPDEEQVPEPIKVFTIQLPDGIEGDTFELELDGEVHSFSTSAWR